MSLYSSLYSRAELLRALPLALVLGALPAGCATERADADACRQINFALCDRGLTCRSWTAPQVDDCKRYYREQCRGGLPGPAPSADQLPRCVAAIGTAACDAIDTAAEVALLDGCSGFLPQADAGMPDSPDAPDSATDPTTEEID